MLYQWVIFFLAVLVVVGLVWIITKLCDYSWGTGDEDPG